MKHSETLKELPAALAAAQAEMPTVPMDGKNPFLNNKYATLGAVIDTLRPILGKHGLALVQFPISNAGTYKRIGRENIGSDKHPEYVDVNSERTGTLDIGLETIILHRSGEWISGEIFIPMTKEKGKSQAQMAGSIISYLRRYAQSAALNVYADEDTDGNDTRAPRRESAAASDEGRFEDLPSEPPATKTLAQSPSPAPKPAPGPAPAPAPQANANSYIVGLRAKLGPAEAEFVRCLNYRKDTKGLVVLLPGKKLDDLSEAWATWFLNHWDEQQAKADAWCAANPADSAPANNQVNESEADAWRAFPMPWGDKMGTPLEKLDKKYLFGCWANVTVETTYNGRPITPEKIELTKRFRHMLDLAGQHYDFHVS